MSQLADVMRRANVFTNGDAFIGKAVFKSPDKKFKTETDENSFVNIDQIVGFEVMNTEITFFQYSPSVLKMLNICNGATVPFSFRGSYETSNGCEKRKFREDMEVQITEMPGSEKKIGKAEQKIIATIHDYKMYDNDELIHHISQDHFVVNGVDMMKEHINNAGG